MRGTDGFKMENGGAANSAEFQLQGGRYQLIVNATFGGGNVVLQQKSTDGSTWIPVMTAITAAGAGVAEVPPGVFRIAVTTATAVYATVTRIPGE